MVTVDPDVASLVRAVSATVDGLVVRTDDARLAASLQQAAVVLRAQADPAAVVTAVRAMYKAVGLDPTKTRPSSEALLRRIRKGGDLPRVNSLVDVINWCSAESRLPFGLYDLGRIAGDVTLRLGRDGEEYPGIRKDTVHLAGRLVLADSCGPFGNPTSDSARTMVTPDTTAALVVIFAPTATAATTTQALTVTLTRIREFCQSPRA